MAKRNTLLGPVIKKPLSTLMTQPERRMNKADAFIEEGHIAEGRAQRMLQMQDVVRHRRGEKRARMKPRASGATNYFNGRMQGGPPPEGYTKLP